MDLFLAGQRQDLLGRVEVSVLSGTWQREKMEYSTVLIVLDSSGIVFWSSVPRADVDQRMIVM